MTKDQEEFLKSQGRNFKYVDEKLFVNMGGRFYGNNIYFDEWREIDDLDGFIMDIKKMNMHNNSRGM